MKRKTRSKHNSGLHTLPELNLHAAGIDIGSKEHYVAVPEGRADAVVKSFHSFTSDLRALAAWLHECKIETVAMESTGVYWIPLFELLETEGFEVLLVNAKHVKNVPGRKTDVSDCQWLQTLHTYGLLRGSFHPENAIKTLRTYLRQKQSLIEHRSSHTNQMQKSLSQMNIQLHNVISSVTGKSGMKIIRAIVEGVRDPKLLVQLCDRRMKGKLESIEKSLEGNYAENHIFTLKQSLELYDFFEVKIGECDARIRAIAAKLPGSKKPKSDVKTKPKRNKKTDPILHKEIVRITGVDLTQIDGLDTDSVMTLISEVGLDMSKWKTPKHFTSWLGLAPNNRISGGKVLSTKTNKVKSRANQTFRLAAFSLANAKSSYLSAAYKRLRFRIGPSKANVAIARKIATIYYHMLRRGEEYMKKSSEFFEEQYLSRKLANLKRTARELGLQVMPAI